MLFVSRHRFGSKYSTAVGLGLGELPPVAAPGTGDHGKAAMLRVQQVLRQDRALPSL